MQNGFGINDERAIRTKLYSIECVDVVKLEILWILSSIERLKLNRWKLRRQWSRKAVCLIRFQWPIASSSLASSMNCFAFCRRERSKTSTKIKRLQIKRQLPLTYILKESWIFNLHIFLSPSFLLWLQPSGSLNLFLLLYFSDGKPLSLFYTLVDFHQLCLGFAIFSPSGDACASWSTETFRQRNHFCANNFDKY